MKSLNILIWGHGKMGKSIENAARKRGHTIVDCLDYSPTEDVLRVLTKQSDVAIEFTQPNVVRENIKSGLTAGLPMVVGTTGWYASMEELSSFCKLHHGKLIWGSNFSVGVNIMFHLNRNLAAILKNFPEYTPEIKEIHHIHKLDAPSGTAISLAKGILNEKPEIQDYSLSRESGKLYIEALRENQVPGFHEVSWGSSFDRIRISHEAHGRDGFSNGALLAAEWLVLQESGWYSTEDLYRFV
jgi:4-hydroxy-tetrahydrodipicolinate reductase